MYAISRRSAARSRIFTNYAAGNFSAGISGGLRGKVIWVIMNNHGSSDYLIHRKTVGEKQEKSKSVVSEQRRHIPGMVWMFATVFIIMGHCVCKWILHITAAVAPFVNVKSEYAFLARLFQTGKPLNFRIDDHAFFRLIKLRYPFYIGIFFAAGKRSRCLWHAVQDGKKMVFRIAEIRLMIHMICSVTLNILYRIICK